MTPGSATPVTTQTQTKDPWSGAQPFLSSMYSTAEGYQQGGVGYLPYAGPTVAPLDPTLGEALGGISSVARSQIASGAPGVQPALNLGNEMLTNYGMSQQQLGALQPIYSAMDQFPGLAQGYANDMGGWLSNAAAYGSAGLGQAGQQYSDIYGANAGPTNPYLLQSIADQNRLATAQVQSSMSGAGRYGSGLYNDAMARAQAEVADPILAQDYQQRQQVQLAATQGQAGVGQAYGQLYAGLGALDTQAAQTQAGMLGQYAGLGAGLSNIYGQGLNLAGQWAQTMPALDQAQYQPYTQLANVGQYNYGLSQQDLAGQIALYNAQQAYPWQQLERQAAIMSGSGQLGGTTVTQQSPLTPPIGQALLGGALVGGSVGSAIPGVGTGLGALGGAAISGLSYI